MLETLLLETCLLPGREIYGILTYLKSGGAAPERGIAMQTRRAAKKSIAGTEKGSTSEAEAGKDSFSCTILDVFDFIQRVTSGFRVN